MPIRRIIADYDQPNFEDTKGLYICTTVRIIIYHPLFRTEDTKDEEDAQTAGHKETSQKKVKLSKEKCTRHERQDYLLREKEKFFRFQ